MSAHKHYWAWSNATLSPFQKLLLMSMADRSGCDDLCTLDYAGWSSDTGIEFEDLESTLGQLVDKKLIRFVSDNQILLLVDGGVML